MATKVVMEALSPTMEEGRLVKWTKRTGDAVKTGETLAEVETDKAIMELVARADGQLLQQAVPEGATVPVGNVVGYIGAPGESVAAAGAPAATSPPPVAAPPAPAAAPPAPPAPVVNPQPAVAQPDRPAVAGVAAVARAPADTTRVKASPLAKRIAQDKGVDLRLIPGSGPGGRVVMRDLDAAVPLLAPTPAVVPAESRPAARAPAIVTSGAAFDDVPLTQIRKTIAKRLATSIGPIPHFFLTTEVDMERAAEAREALNQQLGEQGTQAGKISFNDIVVKAVALALTRHRACNAWWQDDHIRYWNEVHLGMAVAVEDGLITPVIRNAALKSLSQIAAESRELAQRARDRRLKPEEYTGATFSVSNLGMFDIDEFTAVINPPEAGIVAVGSIVPKPVVVNGQVTVRRRLRLTMSCDHRVIDGATGAVFLRTLKQMLENPLAMLL
jgi:pyruvate dehydrogenase E2 component (dihydrolipoamide acetyltransferase)